MRRILFAQFLALAVIGALLQAVHEPRASQITYAAAAAVAVAAFFVHIIARKERG